jgi:nicotinate-nucleotide pyrophosphorylase (carboxylating)
VIEAALAEDLGEDGDLTTQTLIPPSSRSRAVLVTRAAGVIAGLEVADAVFRKVDDAVEFVGRVPEGRSVAPRETIADVAGPTKSILVAERTALNLLGRMSGVASATRRMVEAIEGTGARITDTRKTMPGLRALDKHAVAVGGGINHRMGLYDAVLIKDNHLVAVGNIAESVKKARESVGPDVMIEVEVDDLEQLAEVLTTTADRVLLDNMDTATLKRAVEMVSGRMVTEASGGVTLETVRVIAETGVDLISSGWMTHSAPQLDVALEFIS